MVYGENEPRDLFYRVAKDLIERAIRGRTEFSLAEALAVLLQTWNARYYVTQHHGRFTHGHFRRFERLLRTSDDERGQGSSSARASVLSDLGSDDCGRQRVPTRTSRHERAALLAVHAIVPGAVHGTWRRREAGARATETARRVQLLPFAGLDVAARRSTHSTGRQRCRPNRRRHHHQHRQDQPSERVEPDEKTAGGCPDSRGT
jgi:hypothetical protein